MRRIASLLGNVLLLTALAGLLLLAVWESRPTLPAMDGVGILTEGRPVSTDAGRRGAEPVSTGAPPARREATAAPAAPAAPLEPAPPASLPITRAVVPRIALEADVVPAAFVERDGGTTWEVPAFKAGHAEHTVGAGAPGHAVLLGHVTSRNAGNVFRDLDRVQTGDLVYVFSGARRFDYRVVDVRAIPRDDLSAVQPTEAATLSLITCTGLWLPTIWDYTERLVVRAESIEPSMP